CDAARVGRARAWSQCRRPIELLRPGGGAVSQLRVPFMDLRIQAEALREASLAAFTRVYDSGRFILGSEVQAFEQEVQALLGGVRCVGVSNGTDALVCALSALKIGSGHRVLTTPLTFFATA